MRIWIVLLVSAAVLWDTRPRVQLYFLLTRYKSKGYNIHVIGKSLNLSVHRTCLLKVLVICLRAGFVRGKQCSLLELVSQKAL